ncbi:PHD zinc finger-containing protein, partial [Reticulomyxa filosa]
MCYKAGDIQHKKYYQFQAQRMNYCSEEVTLTNGGKTSPEDGDGTPTDAMKSEGLKSPYNTQPKVTKVKEMAKFEDIINLDSNNNNNNNNTEKKEAQSDDKSKPKNNISNNLARGEDEHENVGVNKYPQTAHVLNCVHGSVIFENIGHLHQGIVSLLTYCRDHKDIMEIVGVDNPFTKYQYLYSTSNPNLQRQASNPTPVRDNGHDNDNKKKRQTSSISLLLASQKNKKGAKKPQNVHHYSEEKVGVHDSEHEKDNEKETETETEKETKKQKENEKEKEKEKEKEESENKTGNGNDRDKRKMAKINDYQCIKFYVTVKHNQRALICEIQFILKCMLEFRQQARPLSIVKNHYHPLVKGAYRTLTYGLGMHHAKLRNRHSNASSSVNNAPSSSFFHRHPSFVSAPSLGLKNLDNKNKAVRRAKPDSQIASPMLKNRYGSGSNVMVNQFVRSASIGSESRRSSGRMQDVDGALVLSTAVSKRITTATLQNHHSRTSQSGVVAATIRRSSNLSNRSFLFGGRNGLVALEVSHPIVGYFDKKLQLTTLSSPIFHSKIITPLVIRYPFLFQRSYFVLHQKDWDENNFMMRMAKCCGNVHCVYPFPYLMKKPFERETGFNAEHLNNENHNDPSSSSSSSSSSPSPSSSSEETKRCEDNRFKVQRYKADHSPLSKVLLPSLNPQCIKAILNLIPPDVVDRQLKDEVNCFGFTALMNAFVFQHDLKVIRSFVPKQPDLSYWEMVEPN